MKKELIGSSLGTILSATGTATQTNEVLQTISLIITIIGGLLTIAMALVAWYNKAKKDGKIDKEEVKEAIDIIQEGGENIKNALNDKKKGDSKHGEDKQNP